MCSPEFKLEVLRVTLQHATGSVMDDPLSAAQKNLEWCLKSEDKAKAPNDPPSRKVKKPGKAKAPGVDSVLFTID